MGLFDWFGSDEEDEAELLAQEQYDMEMSRLLSTLTEEQMLRAQAFASARPNASPGLVASAAVAGIGFEEFNSLADEDIGYEQDRNEFEDVDGVTGFLDALYSGASAAASAVYEQVIKPVVRGVFLVGDTSVQELERLAGAGIAAATRSDVEFEEAYNSWGDSYGRQAWRALADGRGGEVFDLGTGFFIGGEIGLNEQLSQMDRVQVRGEGASLGRLIADPLTRPLGNSNEDGLYDFISGAIDFTKQIAFDVSNYLSGGTAGLAKGAGLGARGVARAVGRSADEAINIGRRVEGALTFRGSVERRAERRSFERPERFDDPTRRGNRIGQVDTQGSQQVSLLLDNYRQALRSNNKEAMDAARVELAGLVNSSARGTRGVLYDRAKRFLGWKPITEQIGLIDDPVELSRRWNTSSLSNNNIDMDTFVRLADADADGAAVILGEMIEQGYIKNRNFYNGFGSRIRNRIAESKFAGVAPEGFLNSNSKEMVFAKLDSLLRQVGFEDKEYVSNLFRRVSLLDQTNPFDRNGELLRIVEDVMRNIARQVEGVNPDYAEEAVRDVTRLYNGMVEDLRLFNVDERGRAIEGPRDRYLEVAGGAGEVYDHFVPGPHIITEFNQMSVPMPDVQELRRLAETNSLKRRIYNSAGWDGFVSAASTFTSKVFKPLVLLRPAYIARTQLDDQLRMAAAGIDSAFSSPLQFRAAMLKDPDAALDLLGRDANTLMAAERVLNSSLRESFSGNGGFRDYANRMWKRLSKPSLEDSPERIEGYVEALRRELIQLGLDPFGRDLIENGGDVSGTLLAALGETTLSGRQLKEFRQRRAVMTRLMQDFGDTQVRQAGALRGRELILEDLNADVNEFWGLPEDWDGWDKWRKGDSTWFDVRDVMDESVMPGRVYFDEPDRLQADIEELMRRASGLSDEDLLPVVRQFIEERPALFDPILFGNMEFFRGYHSVMENLTERSAQSGARFMIGTLMMTEGAGLVQAMNRYLRGEKPDFLTALYDMRWEGSRFARKGDGPVTFFQQVMRVNREWSGMPEPDGVKIPSLITYADEDIEDIFQMGLESKGLSEKNSFMQPVQVYYTIRGLMDNARESFPDVSDDLWDSVMEEVSAPLAEQWRGWTSSNMPYGGAQELLGDPTIPDSFDRGLMHFLRENSILAEMADFAPATERRLYRGSSLPMPVLYDMARRGQLEVGQYFDMSRLSSTSTSFSIAESFMHGGANSIGFLLVMENGRALDLSWTGYEAEMLAPQQRFIIEDIIAVSGRDTEDAALNPSKHWHVEFDADGEPIFVPPGGTDPADVADADIPFFKTNIEDFEFEEEILEMLEDLEMQAPEDLFELIEDAFYTVDYEAVGNHQVYHFLKNLTKDDFDDDVPLLFEMGPNDIINHLVKDTFDPESPSQMEFVRDFIKQVTGQDNFTANEARVLVEQYLEFGDSTLLGHLGEDILDELGPDIPKEPDWDLSGYGRGRLVIRVRGVDDGADTLMNRITRGQQDDLLHDLHNYQGDLTLDALKPMLGDDAAPADVADLNYLINDMNTFLRVMTGEVLRDSDDFGKIQLYGNLRQVVDSAPVSKDFQYASPDDYVPSFTSLDLDSDAEVLFDDLMTGGAWDIGELNQTLRGVQIRTNKSLKYEDDEGDWTTIPQRIWGTQTQASEVKNNVVVQIPPGLRTLNVKDGTNAVPDNTLRIAGFREENGRLIIETDIVDYRNRKQKPAMTTDGRGRMSQALQAVIGDQRTPMTREMANSPEAVERYLQSVMDRITLKTGGNEAVQRLMRGEVEGLDLYADSAEEKAKVAEFLKEHWDSFPRFVKAHVPRGREGDTRRAIERWRDITADYVITKPANYLSRMPAWQGFMVQNVIDLMPQMDDATRQMVFEYAQQNLRMTSDQLQTMTNRVESLKGVEGGTLKDIEMVNELVIEHATHQVSQLLFDVNDQSAFQRVFGNIFPFIDAWREGIEVWSRMLYNRPDFFIKQASRVRAAEESGFIYTNERGERVFANPGSMFMSEWVERLTDDTGPGFGLDVITSAAAAAGATARAVVGDDSALGGATGRFETRLEGVNLLFNSIGPGFGPLIQWPAGAFAPNDPDLQGINELVNPYGAAFERPGEFADVGSWVQAVAPAWAQKVLNAISSGGIDEVQWNSMVSDQMQALVYSGSYDPTSLADRERLLDHATRSARWMLLVRGLTQATFLAGPEVQMEIRTDGRNPDFVRNPDWDPEADPDGTWHQIGILASEYYDLLDKYGDFETAREKFMDAYGTEPAYLAQGRSMRMTSLEATAEAEHWVQQNEGFMGRYPTVAGYFAPPDEGDEFSYAAWRNQIARGERELITPEQQLNLANATRARQIYYSTRRSLEGSGLSGQQLNIALYQVKANLQRQFPGWESAVGPVERPPTDVLIAQLQSALTDPAARNTELFEPLSQYMAVRQSLLSRIGAEAGRPNVTLGGSSRQAYRQALRRYGTLLAQQSPAFSGVWQVLRVEVDD